MVEFVKAAKKDKRGKLGRYALYRAAMTETLFLQRHSEAVEKLKEFVDRSPKKSKRSWEARLRIGEILFTELRDFEAAMAHYESLVVAFPTVKEVPFFYFRVGKSLFFLGKFKESIVVYEDLIKKYPGSKWVEQATYHIGLSYLTSGEQRPDNPEAIKVYDQAKLAFEKFIRLFPKSDLVPQAQFGIASCLEEKEQLEEAYRKYFSLRETYPSPYVIDTRLIRIRERQAQQNQ